MKPEPKAPPLAPQPVKKTSGRKPPAIVKSPIKKAPRKPFKSSRPAPSPKPKLNKPIVPAVQEPAAPDVPFDGPGLTDAELRKVKSGLGKRLLAKFRAQLLERRRELLGDLVGLEAAHKASSGDLSNMPVHMADVGSDAFDREFTLGLMESERHRIQQIDDALERIEAGTYGVCRMSGKPIEHARLEYVPWTRFCVEVARARERHGLK
ncbi:MAG: TraR/DksA C4-type zinc finger protein [Planctomycetota bacterium]